jgi:class 3 adenylate cyclase
MRRSAPAHLRSLWLGPAPEREVPRQPCRAPTATPAPDPRAYTPKHLAEKILSSRAALEGERKQVTVLFADVKGSMDLAERLDPEEWHAIMDRFFAILAEGVHRFEGTVNQYTRDGIMALFAAPIAHEDHAQRACYVLLRALGAGGDRAHGEQARGGETARPAVCPRAQHHSYALAMLAAGDTRAAVDHVREGMRLADDSGEPFGRGRACRHRNPSDSVPR